MTRQVLLIEDDDALRESLAQTLDLEGIDVIATPHYVQARRTIRANFNGVVLTDIRMPDRDGFDILALARAADEDLPVVMLTGEGDVPMAIRAMKEGAWDFLEKPCSTVRLVEVLNRALAHRALVLRNRAAERRLRRSDAASMNFPGTSEASQTLRDALRRVAETDAHALLIGADGVGKKQAAHTIYRLAGADGIFAARTLPFATMATLDAGVEVLSLKRLETARAEDWSALARLLAERPALRIIGSTTTGPTPQTERLGMVPVKVPDLQARHADLEMIFEEILRQAVRNRDMEMPPLGRDIRARLTARHWGGNLAELRIFANQLIDGTSEPAAPQTLAERMETYERSVLEDTLRRLAGKATAAAEELGLPRKTFYDRLARYGLRPKDYQTDRD